MPLILNKRWKTIRQQDFQHAGGSPDNVVLLPTTKLMLDPLDRLVVFLAKQTAEQDHRSAQEDDR